MRAMHCIRGLEDFRFARALRDNNFAHLDLGPAVHCSQLTYWDASLTQRTLKVIVKMLQTHETVTASIQKINVTASPTTIGTFTHISFAAI